MISLMKISLIGVQVFLNKDSLNKDSSHKDSFNSEFFNDEFLNKDFFISLQNGLTDCTIVEIAPKPPRRKDPGTFPNHVPAGTQKFVRLHVHVQLKS